VISGWLFSLFGQEKEQPAFFLYNLHSFDFDTGLVLFYVKTSLSKSAFLGLTNATIS
jgi:hypothetical protein